MIEGIILYNTWLKVLKEVKTNGKVITDERGSKIMELTNIVSTFPNPFFNLNGVEAIPESHPYWNSEKLKVYADQFNSSENPGFKYTYGSRIRAYIVKRWKSSFSRKNKWEYEYVNQVDEVVRKLKNNNNTRRAIIITWRVLEDNKNDEIPCFIMADYKIRNGKLRTTAVWRSHDVFGAYYPNMVGLAYQKRDS